MASRLTLPALVALAALPAGAQQGGGHGATHGGETPSSAAYRAASARMHEDMAVALTGDADVTSPAR